MTRKLSFGLVAGSLLILAACGSSGGGGGVQGINTLGQKFVSAFLQLRNDPPVDAQSVGLRLSPTKQPFNP